MASTTTSQEYNFNVEYSQDDIKLVCKLEDEEQGRRMLDIEGEKLRRNNAHIVSEMFSLNVRQSWFQKGSSYVFNLLSVARNAGNNILNTSQVKAMNVKMQISGTAQDVGRKVGSVGQIGKATAQDVKLKLDATAHEVKEKVGAATTKAQQAGSSVTTKGLETAHGVKEVIKETLGSAQDAAQQGLEKVQGAAKMIKSASLRLIKRATSGVFKLNTGLAFAILEEENERAHRLTSELEVYAILNALAVANLIKAMAPEFYRPEFEPSHRFLTKQLEEYERARREASDSIDMKSVNAKAVASLITAKFQAEPVPVPQLIAAKAEIVEEIKERASPLVATM